MYKVILTLVLGLLINGCSNPTSSDEPTVQGWVFVANEGNFGASNGSISMINNNDEVYHIEEVGDVVQSLEVYEDKLLVVVNNSHMIKVYDISEDGLALPGIEISTDNSSPRELVVVDNKVYFTNWNTKDVKVLNLFQLLVLLFPIPVPFHQKRERDRRGVDRDV